MSFSDIYRSTIWLVVLALVLVHGLLIYGLLQIVALSDSTCAGFFGRATLALVGGLVFGPVLERVAPSWRSAGVHLMFVALFLLAMAGFQAYRFTDLGVEHRIIRIVGERVEFRLPTWLPELRLEMPAVFGGEDEAAEEVGSPGQQEELAGIRAEFGQHCQKQCRLSELPTECGSYCGCISTELFRGADAKLGHIILEGAKSDDPFVSSKIRKFARGCVIR